MSSDGMRLHSYRRKPLKAASSLIFGCTTGPVSEITSNNPHIHTKWSIFTLRSLVE